MSEVYGNRGTKTCSELVNYSTSRFRALALDVLVHEGRRSSNVDAQQGLENGLKWDPAVQRLCFKVK